MTLYGSGLPIISSVRGRLVEIGPAEATPMRALSSR